MIDLILIIILIISISKPEIILKFISKTLREKATKEEKENLIVDLRTAVLYSVLLLESLAISNYTVFISIILIIIFGILWVEKAYPAIRRIKQTVKILKERKQSIVLPSIEEKVTKEEDIDPIKRK